MGKKRILVVDDEPTFTRLLKLNLEAAGDYEVREEHAGNRVMTAVDEFKPDLILLDVVMPDLDGASVGTQLKEQEKLRGIPVVFVTAIVSRDEVGPQGNVIGDHLFIAKPVKVKELVECIEQQLGASGKERLSPAP
jgi:DNA-binding response OmpR family regulator